MNYIAFFTRMFTRIESSKKFLILGCLVCFRLNSVFSQHEIITIDEDSTAIEPTNEASPGVEGDRRPKGVEINYFQINNYAIESKSEKEGVGNKNGEIEQFTGLEFKLKAPVVLKPRTKVLIGLSYKVEEYNFENAANIDYPLYRNLEDKILRSAGLDFYLSRSITKNRFILGKFGLELNGDFTDAGLPFSRFFKYSAAALLGWKVNPRTSYGVGLYLSYTFGRPRIYPGFLWNKTFNEKWGIEALLPANFMVRYSFSEKSILLGGFDVNGQSYHIIIDDPPLNTIKTLELRRSDILLMLTYEQEIYDFLWFSISAVHRFNINFYLSENDDFSNNAILDNNIQNKPYLKFSIFLVPPRKLMSKVLD